MARQRVTIADLRRAARPAHCMYGGIVQLNRIWRVLNLCGRAPAWGGIDADGVSWATYSPDNLAEGLRLVQEQIDIRQARNAKARARTFRRRTTLFAKGD